MKGMTYLWERGCTNGISTVNNNVDIYMILCGYDLNLHSCGDGVPLKPQKIGIFKGLHGMKMDGLPPICHRNSEKPAKMLKED